MSHIVQLAKFYDPVHGGIERVVKDYATGLVAAGHEVTVIAFAHDGATRTDHPSDRLRVVRLAPELRIGPVPLSLRYLWHGWRIGRRADIVHVHEPNPLATIAALLAGSRPVRIVTWHADVVRFGSVRHLYRLLQGALCRRSRGGHGIARVAPETGGMSATGRLATNLPRHCLDETISGREPNTRVVDSSIASTTRTTSRADRTRHP